MYMNTLITKLRRKNNLEMYCSQFVIFALRENCPNTEYFLVRIFPTFGLSMERYFVSLRIQSECGKIRNRKNSIFRHFSRGVDLPKNIKAGNGITAIFQDFSERLFC